MRRIQLILVPLCVVLLAAQKPAVRTVSIGGGGFSPANVSINVGDTVRWSNDDDRDHSIVADNGAFSSPNLKTGRIYDVKFAAAGTYTYHCRLHPREKGKIVVR